MSRYRLYEEAENAIVNWIKAVLPRKLNAVFWDMQDVVESTHSKQPRLPYVVLSLGAPERVGYGDKVYTSQDVYTYTFRKKCNLTINVFAKDKHLEMIESLINSLDLDSKRSILRKAGVAVWTNEPPVDISELVTTKHEYRAAVDLTVSYGKEHEETVGEINTVNYEGTEDLDNIIGSETSL